MRLSLRSRVFALVAPLLGLMFVLVACAPNTSEPIISPALGAILVERAKGGEVVAFKAVVKKIAEMSQGDIFAGLPPEITAALATANPSPENIEALRGKYACAGCHSLDPKKQGTGPIWVDVGDTAANRVANESPALYLYTSITEPGKYIVDGYVDGLMPKDFKTRMSTQELADVITFLVNQHQ